MQAGVDRPRMPTVPLGRVSGRTLETLVTAVRKTPARAVLAGIIRAELGIDGLRALPRELRGPLPFSYAPVQARPSHARASAGLPAPERKGVPRCAGQLSAAFRAGSTTPEQVATRALAHARQLARQQPSLGPLCGYDDARALAAARESHARILSGRARSGLEGVPLAIKEEVNLSGFPTRMGSGYAGHPIAEHDAVAVQRLRAAGAVILGQTPMTEFGLSPLGANTKRRMPQNPHDPRRLAGGSSTGSAVAVACGTTALALGADGGGSIRIPAAHCGIFGLKPTYGRIPTTGLGLPSTTSVVHLGPLGLSSSDLAVFVELAAGQDGLDAAAALAPPLPPDELGLALRRGVQGLRIGIEADEWSHATPTIQRAGRAALDALVRAGATLVEVKSRLMPWAGAIGYLTIGLEGLIGLARIREEHMDELGSDVQLVLAGMDTFRPDDYLDAQRLRAALRAEVAQLLTDVDLLALPTTGRGPLLVKERETQLGFIDPQALDATCRFAFLGNVTGLPAGSAPVGVDEQGLPIGLQLIGDAWDEACVLQALAELERTGAASVPRSPHALDLLM